MRTFVFVFVVVFVLVGCSATNNQPTTHDVVVTDPMEIIRSAAESAPIGVKGEYELYIKATGKQGHLIYLNTEHDYRDQRNVSVVLYPNVITQLTAHYGVALDEFFKGTTIRIKGNARREKIVFLNPDQQPSGKYYFQTQIHVTNISQLELIKERV